MKKHADYALTGVIASLMLFASVQLGFNSDANAGEEELSVTAAGKTVVLTRGKIVVAAVDTKTTPSNVTLPGDTDPTLVLALLTLPAAETVRAEDLTYCNQGIGAARAGNYDLAIDYYTRCLNEGDLTLGNQAGFFYNRGLAYYDEVDYGRAISDYDQAIRLKPDFAEAYNAKAWLLATARDASIRDGDETVRLAQEAVRLDEDEPNYRDTLAAAYAEAGRFNDAVAEQERAIWMLRLQGKHVQVADYRTRLELYMSGQP